MSHPSSNCGGWPSTLEKKWLTRQRSATTLRALQAQLDRFAACYNTARPHRAIGRRTPAQAYTARIKAIPSRPRLTLPAHCRVRHDAIGSGGSVTLRYRSKLYHIGVGRRHAGTKVIILVADLDVRILTTTERCYASSPSSRPVTTSPADCKTVHDGSLTSPG